MRRECWYKSKEDREAEQVRGTTRKAHRPDTSQPQPAPKPPAPQGGRGEGEEGGGGKQGEKEKREGGEGLFKDC